MNIGCDHVNAKVDLDLNNVSSFRLVGGSGDVIMIAPFPFYETGELPYAFMATISTKTLDPHSRLKGD